MVQNRSPHHANKALEENAVLTKALLRLAKNWEMKNTELAEIIGVSPSVISRLRKGESHALSPKNTAGKLALLLIRAYRSLGAFLGSRFTIQQEWLRAHNHAFNRSPLDAMRSPEGLVHVVQYLDAMRGAEG